MSGIKLSVRQLTGFITPFLITGLLFGGAALAGAEPISDESPCANALIDGEQAKEIAADYMNSLGYEEHVGGSNWHFDLQGSTCVNGQWRVGVDLGPRMALKEKAMVLVNCQTGEVEDHFAPELAAE